MNSDDPFAEAISGEAKTYDLTQSIDDLKAAGLKIKGETQLEASDQGLKFKYRSNEEDKKWPTITLPAKGAKDFDFKVDFADLKISDAKEWGCSMDLRIKFDDPEKSVITVGIRQDKSNDMTVLAQRAYDPPEGKRSYEKFKLKAPFDKGSFRMVRRDGKVYCLATGDGKVQSVIASFTIGQRSVSEFSAIARSASDSTELDVVLTGLSLKLEK